MYSTIYSMRQELEQVKKPSGTKENPARTCRDLFYGHPHLKDGKQEDTMIFFWITSNENNIIIFNYI